MRRNEKSTVREKVESTVKNQKNRLNTKEKCNKKIVTVENTKLGTKTYGIIFGIHF